MAAALQAGQMPQPNTFARSKDDILNALSFYFGQPVSPEKLKDYNEHHAATYHFPDAYIGQNTQLRDTINNLVEKSPQTWHTTIGLPFRRIEGTVVEWDEISFDVRLMQRVPYEGVSRMTTSMKRKQRDRIVRRGLAMMIESDFYTTAAGRSHFANQLQSIRYCVQETCNYDVLFSYLTSTNYDFHYDKTHNVRPRRNIRSAMQHEISMYAIAQKEGNGLDKAVEDCKYRMKRYGVTPNMLIIAPQLALYMALAPEEKLSYKEAGPTALANFEAGAEGFTTRSFRGCGVVTSDPFEVSDETEAVQMLQRFTQVGEHYMMSKPPAPPKADQTGFLDILIYDEETDKHCRITWGEALGATFANDLPADATVEGFVAGDKKVKGAWLLRAAAMQIANKVGIGGLGAFTFADDAAAVKMFPDLPAYQTKTEADKALAQAKTLTYETMDCVICIARPFLEHAMLSAVLTVSGQDTGATLFGPSDMQISANTSVKTIEGHYTGHFKSVITKPQNVYVMKDIMSNGYRAGGNCTFFGKNANGVFDKTLVKQQIMDRLNFEDSEADDNHPSLLAFPMSEVQMNKLHNEISISSRLLPWDVHNKSYSYFPGGFNVYQQYNELFGLDQIHFGEDLRASENMEYLSQGASNNALCFTGPHRKYDTVVGAYTAMVPGMGHWGPDARPGDARWRRGEAVSMLSAREQMMTYEQLQYIPKPKA